MMRRRTLIILCLVLGAAVAPSANGYPIPPRTLWEVANDADLIVWARVVEVQEPEPAVPDPETGEYRDIPDQIARLRPLSVWKGRASGGLIEVPFSRNMVCPSPPRYTEGERVLAFLARSEKGWHTVSLSYGTLHPRTVELDLFRALVDAALAGGTLPAEEAVQARFEWAIEAAVHAPTRWHGLYELDFTSDDLWSNYERAQRRVMALNDRQKARIVAGFVAEPRIDATFPMLLQLVKGYRGSHAFDRLVVGAVEAGLRIAHQQWTGEFTTGAEGKTNMVMAGDALIYWAEDALAHAMEYFGDIDAAQRVEEAKRGAWSLEAATARDLWSDAKRRLGIPAGRRVGLQ